LLATTALSGTSAIQAAEPLSPAASGALVDKAENFFEHKAYDKVIETLRTSIDNISRKGILILAAAYDQKGEYSNEIRALKTVVGENDKDFQVHTLIGQAFLKNKQESQAILSFRAALEVNKKYPPAYSGLVTAYEKVNNHYELRILYGDMIGLFGAKAEYLSGLCRINVQDGFFDSAAKYCPEAIEKDAKVPDNHVYWSIYLKESGNEKQAMKVLQKAAESFPNSEVTQWTFANWQEQKKNFILAFKHYQAALKADPKSSRSIIGVAKSAFELQKYQVALDNYSKACQTERKYLQDIRTATSILRTAKEKEWTRKFELAVEKCGI
jgi:tetratricopeptide (TPR) repeat protein